MIKCKPYFIINLIIVIACVIFNLYFGGSFIYGFLTEESYGLQLAVGGILWIIIGGIASGFTLVVSLIQLFFNKKIGLILSLVTVASFFIVFGAWRILLLI